MLTRTMLAVAVNVETHGDQARALPADKNPGHLKMAMVNLKSVYFICRLSADNAEFHRLPGIGQE